jgi:membrane protease YdiL (CAAX protease family)
MEDQEQSGEQPLIVRPSAPAPAGLDSAVTRCQYCGAVLVPRFYFCVVCATPYKSPDSVVPRYRPEKKTDGFVIQQEAPQVWTVFWVYAAVVIAATVLGYLLFGPQRPEYMLFLASAILLATTVAFSVRYWRSLTVQFRQVGFHPAALVGLAGLAPLLGLNYVYHEMFLKGLGVEFYAFGDAKLSDTAMVLFGCLLPAVTEEVAFRGLVQHWLQVVISPWKAIILASALFMALHGSILSAPYLFLVGMALGWTKWKTGSLYPSMVMHFLHNYTVLEYFPG